MISNRCPWTSFGLSTNWSLRHWLAKYQPKWRGSIKDYTRLDRARLIALKRCALRDDPIHASCQSSKIPHGRLRPGRGAGSCRAGWLRSLIQGRSSTISEFEASPDHAALIRQSYRVFDMNARRHSREAARTDRRRSGVLTDAFSPQPERPAQEGRLAERRLLVSTRQKRRTHGKNFTFSDVVECRC